MGISVELHRLSPNGEVKFQGLPQRLRRFVHAAGKIAVVADLALQRLVEALPVVVGREHRIQIPFLVVRHLSAFRYALSCHR
jgi:hypothetical protein